MQPPYDSIPWNVPTPGGAPPAAANPLAKLGSTCFALGILELVHDGWSLLGSVAALPMLAVQRKVLAATTPGAAPVAALFGAIERLLRTMMLWQLVRLVPYVVASSYLVAIGSALRNGRVEALARARAWTFWAFGAIAFSIAVQAVFVVPAQMDFQDEIVEQLAALGSGSATPLPPGFGAMFGILGGVAGVVTVVVSSVVMAIWPIVLRVWVDRLAAELTPSD